MFNMLTQCLNSIHINYIYFYCQSLKSSLVNNPLEFLSCSYSRRNSPFFQYQRFLSQPWFCKRQLWEYSNQHQILLKNWINIFNSILLLKNGKHYRILYYHNFIAIIMLFWHLSVRAWCCFSFGFERMNLGQK